MIEIVVGQVGSGKSYYATYKILEEIKKIYAAEVKNETYKYKVIYTNIEGIQENKYVKHFNIEEYYKLWKWELEQYTQFLKKHAKEIILPALDFTEKEKETFLKELEELQEENKAHTETNLIIFNNKFSKILNYINTNSQKIEEFVKHTRPFFAQYNFTNALFIIDEAHNFFKYCDKVKMRAMSFHRHYDEDYILITQDLKNLDRRITNIALKTIKATNPSVRLSSNFVYKVYSGGYISYRNTNLIQTIKLKKSEEIFRLYETGGKIKTQNILFRYALRLFIPYLFLIAIGVSYYFYKQHNYKPAHVEIIKNTKNKKNKKQHKTYLKYITITQIGNTYFLNNKPLTQAEFLHLINTLHAKKIVYSPINLADERSIKLFY